MLRRLSRPDKYDATLRIFGCGALHEEITRVTGIVPTLTHHKGDPKFKARPELKTHADDLWLLSSDLAAEASLSDHVGRVAALIKPHKKYFIDLIKKAEESDIILGCLSDCSYPMLWVDAKALKFISSMGLGLVFNFTVAPPAARGPSARRQSVE